MPPPLTHQHLQQHAYICIRTSPSSTTTRPMGSRSTSLRRSLGLFGPCVPLPLQATDLIACSVPVSQTRRMRESPSSTTIRPTASCREAGPSGPRARMSPICVFPPSMPPGDDTRDASPLFSASKCDLASMSRAAAFKVPAASSPASLALLLGLSSPLPAFPSLKSYHAVRTLRAHNCTHPARMCTAMLVAHKPKPSWCK